MPLAEGHSEGKGALTKKQDVSGADGVSVELEWYSGLMWGVRAVWCPRGGQQLLLILMMTVMSEMGAAVIAAVIFMRFALLLSQEHPPSVRLRGTTLRARELNCRLNCLKIRHPTGRVTLLNGVHYVMLSPVRCVSYVSSNSIIPSKLHTQRFLVFRRHTRCQVL